MINIYKINKDKFKTIYLSINFTMNVNEEENSRNALLASVLSKSCEKFKTQKQIENYMYSLYGAEFDVNVEKYGDLYNIEFLIEGINKKFLPDNQDIVSKCIDFLYNIVYKPNVVNDSFNEEIVKREKEFILDKIRTKKDDKLRYGVTKMEELMCYSESFGMYLYGDEKIVENITAKELYAHYLHVINNSCISIIASGNLEGYENIEEQVKEVFNEKINTNVSYEDLICDSHIKGKIEDVEETIEESDTYQSVLSMGFRVEDATKEDFYVLNLYNAILGATPSSKLFQNVRERESLAYTVRSRFYRFKNIFVIFAGIERDNYKKAVQVINEQIEDIKNGNITDDEFFAAKESLIADLKEWDDSKIALSKMLLANMLLYKNNNISVDDMIEGISNVSKDDVVNIANKIILERVFLLGGASNE